MDQTIAQSMHTELKAAIEIVEILYQATDPKFSKQQLQLLTIQCHLANILEGLVKLQHLIVAQNDTMQAQNCNKQKMIFK